MTETVLLIGGGGREHAIARALNTDDATLELYACASNRNPGITTVTNAVKTLTETDPTAVVEYAEAIGATLAIVGPEAPLAAGVVDALGSAGIYAFGPRQAEARIETDKAFQRQFMAENDIPGCPAFGVFETAAAACERIDTAERDLAIKPAGLTGGKGVRVTGDQIDRAAAKEHARTVLQDHDRLVIEHRLTGEEVTVQAFVANGEVRPMPAVQDHKRAFENDEGPNTGGMGSYTDTTATLPFMTDEEYATAVGILEAVVAAMPEYRGVLYGQFMLTADEPMIVEFNARFGDPEAMNVLPVMQTDLLSVLTAARDGESLPALEFAPTATVCKYAVPAGYPTDPTPGARVTIDDETVRSAPARELTATSEPDSDPTASLFYASVDQRDDGIYATTSRSFAVVGQARSIADAEAAATAALAGAGEEFRVRADIGTEASVQQRVGHMRRLREQ